MHLSSLANLFSGSPADLPKIPRFRRRKPKGLDQSRSLKVLSPAFNCMIALKKISNLRENSHSNCLFSPIYLFFPIYFSTHEKFLHLCLYRFDPITFQSSRSIYAPLKILKKIRNKQTSSKIPDTESPSIKIDIFQKQFFFDNPKLVFCTNPVFPFFNRFLILSF